jgi:hypothetical protein
MHLLPLLLLLTAHLNCVRLVKARGILAAHVIDTGCVDDTAHFSTPTCCQQRGSQLLRLPDQHCHCIMHPKQQFDAQKLRQPKQGPCAPS